MAPDSSEPTAPSTPEPIAAGDAAASAAGRLQPGGDALAPTPAQGSGEVAPVAAAAIGESESASSGAQAAEPAGSDDAGNAATTASGEAPPAHAAEAADAPPQAREPGQAAAAGDAGQAPASGPDEAVAPRTAEIADAGPRLRALFPALFGNPPKPLKLRIQQDIQQRAPGQFSKQALTAFLRRYTGSHGYLVALANAKSRFGLDGEAAGEVAAEHRQAAIDELARRRANRQARVELDEQQRRNRATLLRDFEATTLTPANFCALKGVAVEELDGLLERARAEAAERSQAVREQPGARRMPSPGERRRRTPRRQETRWT